MTSIPDQVGLQSKWQAWAEKEVGGPPARIQAATAAAVSAANQGQTLEATIAAAQQAAASWTANHQRRKANFVGVAIILGFLSFAVSGYLAVSGKVSHGAPFVVFIVFVILVFGARLFLN
jgi:hypothetical protein